MNITERDINVSMKLTDLKNIPEYVFPGRYSTRRYLAGDEAKWVSIWSAAEKRLSISLDVFEREFGEHRNMLGERLYFLFDPKGEAVGTSAAWSAGKEPENRLGLIHWIALAPHAQGLGLSKPLMTLTCRRLKELGHTSAFLNTSTGRVAAVNLYLSFGFKPALRKQEDEAIWEEMKPFLRRPVSW